MGKSVDDPTAFLHASKGFSHLSPAQVILPLLAVFGEFLEYVPVLGEVPSVLISDVLSKNGLQICEAPWGLIAHNAHSYYRLCPHNGGSIYILFLLNPGISTSLA